MVQPLSLRTGLAKRIGKVATSQKRFAEAPHEELSDVQQRSHVGQI